MPPVIRLVAILEVPFALNRCPPPLLHCDTLPTLVRVDIAELT